MVHMQHNAYVVGACLIKCLSLIRHTNEVEVGRERVSSLKKPNMFMFC